MSNVRNQTRLFRQCLAAGARGQRGARVHRVAKGQGGESGVTVNLGFVDSQESNFPSSRQSTKGEGMHMN